MQRFLPIVAFGSASSFLLMILGLAAIWHVSPTQAQVTGPATALHFNGTNAYVDIPNFGNVAPTTEVTIEFWQRVSAVKGQGTFSVSPVQPKNGIDALVPWSDGTVNWDFGNPGSGGRVSYTPPVSIIGTWQHFALVATHSGNYMAIYRNGVLEALRLSTMTPFTTSPDFHLFFGQDAGFFFGGDLDEFRVWNVARTTAQIQSNLNRSLVGNEPGLVAYWRFDEGAGTNSFDGSGHGLVGSFFGNPTWIVSSAPITNALAGIPTVQTLPADNLLPIGATLNGNVIANGSDTATWFEYGVTTNYGSTTATNMISGTNSGMVVAVSNLVSGLALNTLYHYRVLAANPYGTTRGNDFVFSTTGFGYALHFNGTNNYVDIPNFGNIAPTNEITIEFWQRVDAVRSQCTLDISPDPTTYTNRINAHAPWSDGKVYWDFGNIHTVGRLAYNPPVSIVGTWQHFALVASQSGNYMAIYRNGVLEAQKTGMTPFVRGNYDLILGASPDGALFYAGDLDEVRIWNLARTANQIQSNFDRSLAGNEPGLLAYWRLDEGASTLVQDSSGHDFVGHFVPNPLWIISTAPITNPPVGLPAIATLPASNLLTNGASLNGLVNPDGSDTSAWFQYGPTTNYGNNTAATSVSGTTFFSVSVSTLISNLSPLTPYHYRVVATNTTGTSLGADVAFTTSGPTNSGPGNALHFNRAGSYVRVPNFGFVVPTNEITIEFWQRAAAVAGQGVFSFDPAQTTNGLDALLPWTVDADAYWDFGNYDFYTPNNGRLSYTLPTFLVGTWQHFAMVASQSGNYMAIYRNGVLEAQRAAMKPLVRGAYDLLIGVDGGYFFAGDLDEFRVWNVARTASQIQSNLNHTLVGNEAGLVAYWRFDDATGGGVTDNSGQGNGGELVNGPARVLSTAPILVAGVVTLPASDITTNGATLNGTLDPNGTAAVAWFQYGATTNFGGSTPPIIISATNPPHLAVNAAVSDLSPGTPYFFQLVVSNATGVNFGGVSFFTAVPLPTPVSGYAMHFNGSGSYIQIPGFGNVVPTNEITVEFWQRVAAVKRQSTFAFNWVQTANVIDAHVPWSDGKVYWDFGDYYSVGQLSYTPPVSIVGTWQHFALVASQSGNFMAIYRNGVMEAQKTGMTTITRGAYDLLMGQEYGGYATSFEVAWASGDLDEFRVWNVARDASQIESNFNRPLAGNEPGLVAYWRFDEGAGTNISDSSGHGLTGILADGPTWFASTAPFFLSFATTLPASNRGLDHATLNGTVNPGGSDCAAWFQYGVTTNYGLVTTSSFVSAAMTTNVGISNLVMSLLPSTIYHFQMVASNGFGVSFGEDRSFLTDGYPLPVTQPASGVSPNQVFVHGTVNPNSHDTTVWFLYGTDTNYGGVTAAQLVSGTNPPPVSISAGINNLLSQTLYHCQLIASNSLGVGLGGDVTFTTLPGTNNLLASLTCSGGPLYYGFAPGITHYNVGLSPEVTSIFVTPTLADATASIAVQINDSSFISVASGAASPPLALHIGLNTINIRVTAQDGISQRIYSIAVGVSGPDITVGTTNANGPGSLAEALTVANYCPGPHLITLASNAVYSCTVTDNFWYGPNALPPIASDITIEGNGSTMQRTIADRLRFFYIGADPNNPATSNYNSPGAGKLTLRNLTLKNGLALGGIGGGGGAGMGGAIFNQGSLVLDSVTLVGNTAKGGDGGFYAGGGMGEDSTVGRGGGFGGSVIPSGSQGSPGGGLGGGGGGFGVFDNGNPGNQGGGVRNGLGGGGGGNGSGSGRDSYGVGGAGGAFGFGGVKGGSFSVGSSEFPAFSGDGGGGGGVGGGGGGGGPGDGFSGVYPGFAGGGGFGGGGAPGNVGSVLGNNDHSDGAGPGGFGGGGGPSANFQGRGGYGGGDSGLGITSGAGGGGAGMGGAIFNHNGSVVINNCTFTQNNAQGGSASFGGGLSSFGTIGGNGGSGFGGAVFNLNGGVTITSSTLAGNGVGAGAAGGVNPGGTKGVAGWADGGAIYTMVYDSAMSRTSTVTIANSILAGTTNGADVVNAFPAMTSAGTNLGSSLFIATAPNIIQSFTNTGGIFTNTGVLAANPLLGPLTNNGGPTPTMLPLPGSPASDAGDSTQAPASDQRGLPRISGAAVDLGAVESPGAPYLYAVDLSASGPFQLVFLGNTNSSYTVFSSTDPNLPFADWTPLGPATQLPNGLFQFTDSLTTNGPARYYRVRQP